MDNKNMDTKNNSVSPEYGMKTDGPTTIKNNSVLPEYGTKTDGPTPFEKQQQQQQTQQVNSNGYPGAAEATPSFGQDIQGYDQNGNPIIPSFIAQRHRIEQSLGPTCPADGGYHDLRMHWSNTTLLVAILILPYCCGYRGKKECVCKKCHQKFPDIVLPQPD